MINDPFISHNEMENELREIENLGISLARNLSLLSQKTRYIISKIKSCDSLEYASDYFDVLDKIITTLNLLVYKEELGISDRLLDLMYKFDNIHENKEYYFAQIQTGEYYF